MKSKRSFLRSPWLAGGIVVAAIWVNRQHFGALAQFVEERKVDPGVVAELVQGEVAPAPGVAAVPTFFPAVFEARLEDPFAHDLETRMLASRTTDVRVVDLELPVVRLVLLGPSTRRAVVDGAVVGVGDTCELGRIEAIDATGIHVATEKRGIVHIPLTTALREERVSADATDAEVDPGRAANAADSRGSQR